MYFLLVGSHYVLRNELWAENVKSNFRGHVLGDSTDSVVKDGCIFESLWFVWRQSCGRQTENGCERDKMCFDSQLPQTTPCLNLQK